VTHAVVTGATGFTGLALCRRLVERGVHVTALVRRSPAVPALEQIGVECRLTDLTDRLSIESQLPRADILFHLAAAYRTEHADRNEFFRVNVEGTRHLLDAAIKRQVGRFVHCSTVGVQGQIDDPPATELTPVAPGDHYQDSKLEGEQLALSYQDRIDVRVVRPVGIYGPGDMRFLKLFRGVYRGRFVLIGGGRNLYHLTYIEDLITGIILTAEASDAAGEIFTICGPRYTTVAELVKEVARAVQRPVPKLKIPLAPVYAAAFVCEHVCRFARVPAPLYRRRLDFFAKDRAFDCGKARRMLGYEPQVDLPEGLRLTADWYASQGML
jgi:nucleoside-diphosphate-sugar epimerase